jgi:thiamine-phosphate pyrophosphorylase
VNQIRGVYAVTPEADDCAQLLQNVEQCLRGGVRLLQYRNKIAPVSVRTEQAARLADLCRDFGAVFIVNDHVDLARQVDADGVHLGREDGLIDYARTQLGPHKLIGVSCYNEIAIARRAVAAGANYVAFGSVFASSIKPQAVQAPLRLLTEARASLSVPVVAIGGISLANAAAAIGAGADSVAVISGLFEQASVENAARALCALFEPETMRT